MTRRKWLVTATLFAAVASTKPAASPQDFPTQFNHWLRVANKTGRHRIAVGEQQLWQNVKRHWRVFKRRFDSKYRRQ